MGSRPGDFSLLAPLQASFFVRLDQFRAQEFPLQRHIMEMALSRARSLSREWAWNWAELAKAENMTLEGLENIVEKMDYWQQALRIYGYKSDSEDYAKDVAAARERLGQMRSDRIEGKMKDTAAALGDEKKEGEEDISRPSENGNWAMLEALRKRLSMRISIWGSISDYEREAIWKRLHNLALESGNIDIQRAVAKTLIAELETWYPSTGLILNLQRLALIINDEGLQRIVIRGLLKEMRAVNVEPPEGTNDPLWPGFEDRKKYKLTLALIIEYIAAFSAYDNIREIAIQGLTADPSFSEWLLERQDLLAPVERLAVGAGSKRVKALAVSLILREINRPDAETVNKGKLVEAADRIAQSAGGLGKMDIPTVAIGVGRALREHAEAATGTGLLGLAGVLYLGSMGFPILAIVLIGWALSHVAILGLRTDQPGAGFLQTLLIGGFYAALVGWHASISLAPGDMVLLAAAGLASLVCADYSLKSRKPWVGIIVNLLLFGLFLAVTAAFRS